LPCPSHFRPGKETYSKLVHYPLIVQTDRSPLVLADDPCAEVRRQVVSSNALVLHTDTYMPLRLAASDPAVAEVMAEYLDDFTRCDVDRLEYLLAALFSIDAERRQDISARTWHPWRSSCKRSAHPERHPERKLAIRDEVRFLRNYMISSGKEWCPGAESNHRHASPQLKGEQCR